MIRCLSCGAETGNGLALCDLCRRKVATVCEILPIYFRNLARWQPGQSGSRSVPGSRVLWTGEERRPDATGDRISDTLDQAHTALVTWARCLHDDRRVPLPEEPTEVDAVVRICALLVEHLTSIATLDWAGELVRDLDHHEHRLRTLTEVSVPGWYAGACRKCSAPTYVVPGLTWLTCRSCGTTTHAGDHLDVILTEARGWVARPKPLAEAVVALVDAEQSVPRLYARIRQWAVRGDLEPVYRIGRGYEWDDVEGRIVLVEQETGHARYRLGDVMDRVRAQQFTITEETA